MPLTKYDSNDIETPVLYWSGSSLCSLIVRYTIALQQGHATPGQEFVCSERAVNIKESEQLADWYLLNVNPKGTIPALHGATDEPLTDSQDITFWLMQAYPSLAPAQHLDEITDLVKGFYKVQFPTLSFFDNKTPVEMIIKRIDNILAQKDISPEYREALLRKKQINTDRIASQSGFGGFAPETIVAAEETARVWFSKIAAVIEANKSSTPWIYATGPTVLDADVAVLVARIRDVSRAYLIPDAVSKKVDLMMERPEWKEAGYLSWRTSGTKEH